GGGGGGGGGGATHVVPQGPLTAFELFCRDAEARRVIEDCGDLQDEDSLEGRCSSRRLLAEAWLSADAATRERFETAAATAVAALKPSRAAGVKQLRSSRNASTSRRRKTPTAAAATTTASSSNNATIVSDTAPPSEGDSTAMANTTETGVRRGAGMLVTSYKRPPTSYRLFCKRQRGVYGSNDALMRAWRGMSSTEKQPYDDEAAAIRVALRK
ncbi:hypothetical protein DQ04_10291020, partial [Trypanosoma grayi]|uniref:hypothetical protein n=1 Tax=Trypanosoma grayi TaxID=71804 RepID=UPI0004F499E9